MNLPTVVIASKQPKKCQNCIWGHWNGVTQYCPKPICVKEMCLVEKQRQYQMVNVDDGVIDYTQKKKLTV